jgi:hypothetical protein
MDASGNIVFAFIFFDWLGPSLRLYPGCEAGEFPGILFNPPFALTFLDFRRTLSVQNVPGSVGRINSSSIFIGHSYQRPAGTGTNRTCSAFLPLYSVSPVIEARPLRLPWWEGKKGTTEDSLDLVNQPFSNKRRERDPISGRFLNAGARPQRPPAKLDHLWRAKWSPRDSRRPTTPANTSAGNVHALGVDGTGPPIAGAAG